MPLSKGNLGAKKVQSLLSRVPCIIILKWAILPFLPIF